VSCPERVFLDLRLLHGGLPMMRSKRCAAAGIPPGTRPGSERRQLITFRAPPGGGRSRRSPP
jgi:hypothetical protein